MTAVHQHSSELGLLSVCSISQFFVVFGGHLHGICLLVLIFRDVIVFDLFGKVLVGFYVTYPSMQHL
jgi:hypothetical protein